MRQMPHPIPVLTGSEYRERKTMRKDVRQNTTGKKRGTCGHGRTIYRCYDVRRGFRLQQIYTSTQLFKMQKNQENAKNIFILLVL